ncbi:polysaccharide biosynthesis tyrosine autokinase [Paraburkholderia phenazinium]|jgi:tyrosine-protein kinase Etk/Wzc|uniref:Tyrosine-protein kinase Etk/Wzc n=1 Tax=Paraburkholderia phenazinium TaxID=60549 RepID=A0A1G8EP94_9BURK|nr:polysaccharide biosynthesis tyrosine autokinase [Paraburkholderia phenazinium]SDH71711.1 tyrosine-protein kinase Etk/Wzc [Paraburkholderia phenazinium]
MSTYDTIEATVAPGGEEDAVMRDLGRMIIEQIWWVIGIAAAVILAATVYAKISTPIYSADALIQVDSGAGNVGSSSPALASLMPSGGVHTDAEIEIIKSRAVVEPVVEQFKLNFGAWPRTMPYLSRITSLFARDGHPLGALFGMGAYAWGGEEFAVDSISVPAPLEGATLTLRALGAGRYQLFDQYGKLLLTGVAGRRATGSGISIDVTTLVARPDTEFYVMRFPQLDAVTGLAGGLQVMEKGHDTGIVQLSFMGPDPHAITAITNAVAQSYLRHRQARAQEEASRMLNFLNSEMPRLRAEVQRAETALSEYQSRSGSFQPTVEASVYLSGGLEYEKAIAAMRVTRAELLTRFTPDSLEVQTLDSQLASMQQQKDRFDDHFKTLPRSEREAMSLQRDAKVAEDIYVALLNKIQELSITRAGTIGNVHIIDEALLPSSPVRPKSALIISAGTALGIIAGVLFAFCRRTFFTGVADPEFIERRFQMPIFGSISYSAEQARNDRLSANHTPAALPGTAARFGVSATAAAATAAAATATVGTQTVMPVMHKPVRPLLAKTNPFDTAVEGLRGLRATLQFGLIDAPNRVVAFTSPAPSDGKSFLCANLAALLAETGRRVLLIDADLRRGRLAQYLGRAPNGGLTELLTGQIDLEVVARPTGVDGLHFIAAGAYPPNPSEILTSTRFTEVLARFEQQFDLVIVDTPPLLAAADAAIIANIAGSTVLVMRSGAHTERDIAESLKKLRRARARLIGGVINAVPLRNGGRYGASDYTYAYAYTAGEQPGGGTK